MRVAETRFDRFNNSKTISSRYRKGSASGMVGSRCSNDIAWIPFLCASGHLHVLSPLPGWPAPRPSHGTWASHWPGLADPAAKNPTKRQRGGGRDEFWRREQSLHRMRPERCLGPQLPPSSFRLSSHSHCRLNLLCSCRGTNPNSCLCLSCSPCPECSFSPVPSFTVQSSSQLPQKAFPDSPQPLGSSVV